MAPLSLWRNRALCLWATALTCAAAADPVPYTHDETFVPDRVLRVTAENITQACQKQTTVVVNGTTPGPELRILEGQTTWIRVYNDMSDRNLTMHWHGLSMDVAPFSDGTPLVSQWPIPPNHFFDYEVYPDIGHAGTYFYHSHVGFQSVSAAGALIVEDNGTLPYVYDEDKTIVLTDIYNKTDSDIEAGLVANPFVWSNWSQEILVNGQGSAINTSSSLVSNCTSPLAVIDLKANTTYRLRFIGATAMSFVSLAFQGHDSMVLIEADGAYTKPHTTDFLQIGSGQRYSVLLKTKSANEVLSDRKKNVTFYYAQLESRDLSVLTRGYAVLRYILPGDKNQSSVGPPATPPINLRPTVLGWLDYELEPLYPNNFPTLSEVTRRVTITVEQAKNGTIVWDENGLPWTEAYPRKPYLVALYENDTSVLPSYTAGVANGGMDPAARAFPAKVGEVLEIVFQNTGSVATPGQIDSHPFHAHGTHYYNIGSGNGTYDVEANERRLNGTNPVQRDTTVLYQYEAMTTPGTAAGWRAWRLRADNPGVWMIHCHILQHMIMGMQTILVIGNETELRPVSYSMAENYLTYGGSVMGNATNWPQGTKFHP